MGNNLKLDFINADVHTKSRFCQTLSFILKILRGKQMDRRSGGRTAYGVCDDYVNFFKSVYRL